MLRVALIVTPLALVTAIACGDSGDSDSGSNNTGGTTSTTAGDTGQPEGGDSTATNTGGTSGKGGTSSTQGGTTSNTNGGTPSEMTGGAGVSSSAGGVDTSAGGAGTGAGGAGACPDLFGDYSIKTSAGMCGNFNKNAAQAIDGNDSTCAAHFVSAPAKGEPGVNGTTNVDASGGFKDVKLTLGTMQRNPCSGTYNDLTGTMTIKCGGAGDLCTIVMTKK